MHIDWCACVSVLVGGDYTHVSVMESISEVGVCVCVCVWIGG